LLLILTVRIIWFWPWGLFDFDCEIKRSVEENKAKEWIEPTT
jgi:hypothetical protein